MDAHPAELQSRRVEPLLAAGFSVLLLVLNGLWLSAGHPFEDAYILFIYVENAVAGHGVVYYPGGPPTEGFTDTLWFAALVALGSLGLDVAWAAAVMTALSGGVIAGVMMRTAPARWGVRAVIALWLITFHGTVASLGGFGCLFFCAFLALAWFAVWRRRVRSQWLLLALLPLVRLEGWAAAGGLWVVLFCQQRGNPRAWGWGLVAVLVPLGLLTLLRWQWFGLPLPLPAFVKGAGGAWFPGWGSNLNWSRRAIGPLPWLVLILLVAVKARRRLPGSALWAAVPALCVLVPLLLAEQMQNVRWRFQAPATLGVVLAALATWRSAWEGLESKGRRWLAVLGCLACAPGVVIGTKQLVRGLGEPPHLFSRSLAPRLGECLPPDHVFATTEAGILAFRQDCRVVDLVGLNTEAFARRLVTVADLARLAPDLLVCNTYGVLDLGSSLGDGASPERRLSGADLRRRRVVSGRRRLRAVATACFDFLAQHPEYDVRAVREGRNVLVYAFRPPLATDPRWLQLWNRARASPLGRGYFDSWPQRR